MKAAVLHAIGKPLRIEDVAMPTIGATDVLVRTSTCGICRTDLHIQDGAAYVPALPHIPGHEPAGVVEAVGGDVKTLAVGQRVAPHLFFTCGTCWHCQAGADAQCSKVRGILGVTKTGAFAEYFAAPAMNLIALPDSVEFAAGGLTSCAAVTALHAVERSRVTSGETAAVIGVGGVGQLIVQILKSIGTRVVAIDRSEMSLRTARQSGAGLSVLAGDANAVRQVGEFAGALGVTCIFDIVGTSASLRTATELVRNRGRIVVIGEEADSLPLTSTTIAQREIEIIGSRNGSRRNAADAVAMLADGRMKPTIDRRFPLDQINEAFDYVRSGAANGRVVITIRE